MLAVTLRENALTTLDALKTSLGIDPEEEDAQRDATLVQLINAASAWLETQLGRKLGKSTYRQKYCGTGTQMLSLEQYPIVSVERITDTFTGETITDFDFNETGEIGVLFREDGWTYGGDKPHIGAVGVADPAGKITVTQFEGHKEGSLCQHWCEKLFKAVNCPVVVSAGIHYDNASKKEILQVVEISNVLLEMGTSKLRSV